MIIASGSSHGLSFIKEAVPDTTPALPTMQALRHTSCSLNLTRDSFQSQELRHDRMISGIRTGADKIGGAIGFELSYGAYDELLEGLFCDTWQNDVLKAADKQISYTFERAFNDISQYTVYAGCYLNNFSLSLKPNALVTGTFNVVGLSAASKDTTVAQSLTASPTHLVYDTFTGVLKEGGTTIGLVTGLDLTLDNGITPQFVLMQKTSPFVSFGRSNVTGTLSVYFTSLAFISKFLNETPTSLEFTLGEAENTYTFLLPNIRYTGADNPASNEGPIVLNMPFQAILDPVLGTNIQLTRAGTFVVPIP